MPPIWLKRNHLIDLPKVFGHLGFELISKTDSYLLYRRGNVKHVVILCENGYNYYNVDTPQRKLEATDLILEHMAKVEEVNNESVWEKVNAYYSNIIDGDEFLYEEGTKQGLMEVSSDFNHFNTYADGSQLDSDFYDGIDQKKFGDSIRSLGGMAMFPLRNLQNEVCGFFREENEVRPYKESAVGNSLWYSNVPEKIDWLLVFRDPVEAIAFDKKFQLANAVYIALGEINYRTSKILFAIQKMTKVKKIVISFTGSKKIEGYLRDLHFISFINDSNFQITLEKDAITTRFLKGDEKSFSPFFNGIKRFNRGLAESFLNYNKVMDQRLVNQFSILLSKENQDDIKTRIPLEVNAIKYFVWCYFKNYLSRTLDILKPKQASWYMEWEASQSIPLKGKEVLLEEYRIAL